MIVIPAIDIRDGRCVRLYQGDYAQEKIYADDPVAIARRWSTEGAAWLHVVDLDGAREGTPAHFDLIAELVQQVPTPVQVGGGIRSRETVERYLQCGVRRIILGTAAAKDIRVLKESCERWPESIVVSIDARDQTVLVSGWLESTALSVQTLVDQLLKAGVRRLAYTDISRDGTLTHPNYDAIRALLDRVTIPVLIAGGVSAPDQITALKGLGVEGVIVGRALYERRFTLAEAIEHAR